MEKPSRSVGEHEYTEYRILTAVICALITAGLLNISVEITFLWLTQYKYSIKLKYKTFTQVSIQIPKTISQFYAQSVQKTLACHVIWVAPDSGSCRQPEVTSAVIQKTATRRSKQTRQQEQHKHKHGSTDGLPPTGWVRECRTELGGGRWGWQVGHFWRCCPREKLLIHAQRVFQPLFLPFPPAAATHALQPQRSWDLSAFKPARCVVHVLPRGEKKGNWLEVWGKLKLCLICFNLAFSELLCESAGKLTLEV